MKHENKITFRVTGRMALFSDPITRVGGEKFSYPVPTYQALKGICENSYWKPSIIWEIIRCRIMKPIRTETRGMRVPKYNDAKANDLSVYTYLRGVEYIVEARFKWNEQRPELACDRNENKHYFIAKRMLERGGRRDIFLGTRECSAYVEPCSFDEGEGYYDNKSISFGIMVHGITYPDESGLDRLQVRLWDAKMENGVINFIRPEECTMVTDSSDYKIKSFEKGKNFSGLKEFEKEGIFSELDDTAGKYV